MASIEMSTQTESPPPISAGQDPVASLSEPLVIDTPSNLTSIDVSTQTESPPPILAGQAKPRALWLLKAANWLGHTEIKTSPLTLAIALIGLIMAVIYGTSTWLQSSTATDSATKATRLALFTACISFPEQPNVANSNFCKANRNASLDGFVKRDIAALSLPVLWDMDVLAEALEIVHPVWQCKAVCDQETVLYPPDLPLMLSIPISNGENCQLDCVEPIRAKDSEEGPGPLMFTTACVITFFPSISPKLPKRSCPSVSEDGGSVIFGTIVPNSLVKLSNYQVFAKFVSLGSK
ncbi:hypothetical protein EAE96_006893 [Botrytis aclada]|nr:hypothetical protein EAE96_006893 [Botrytis aclada]